jgi:hypothetical protein
MVMTQYPLAFYREYAVPIHPQQTQQVPAGVNVLGDKLTDAGAFVFRSGLLPAESATAAKMTREEAS